MGSDLPFRAVVDLPPQAGSLAAYSATLGHKANHRPPPRNNAIYLPFSVHPVLGRVMSVVALRDIRQSLRRTFARISKSQHCSPSRGPST